VKWRYRIGEEKMKTLIAETIRLALENPFVSPKELSKTVGDTTVQEKNITYPTDAKLLSRAIIQWFFNGSGFGFHGNNFWSSRWRFE
jgi:hypothetical protein